MLTPKLSCFQAEFQRLALGFKCDMFTLEKRLRLEERSRDLAEENVRREVSSCQGLLQVGVFVPGTVPLSVDGVLNFILSTVKSILFSSPHLALNDCSAYGPALLSIFV